MSVNHLTSFKTLFQELYPGMVKIALFYVHDLAIAEDITQEIFTRLWERREKLDMIDNLKGYLSNELAKDDYIEEFIQKVQISLEKLPPKRRQILEMSIVEAKSYQEIADQEGISLNTVKDHIKKAYAFIRKDIHRNVPDFILFIAFQTKSEKTKNRAFIF